MTRRLGLWALVGLIVACCWVIIGMTVAPHYNLGRSTFVLVTAPASYVGRKIPLAFYWFILLNAVAYVIVGLAAEGFSRALRHNRA